MEKRARVINLHCDVCGTEIMVSASGDYKWHPIYCCGLEIHGVEGTITQPSKKKLAARKSSAKVKTGVTGKKKLAARKSSAKVKTGATGKKKAAGKRTLPKPKKK